MTFLITAWLLPRPNAASRSTRWIHSAPWLDPVLGRIDRVAVAGLGAGLALGQADCLAVGHIHRGEEDQTRGGVELAHLLLSPLRG